MTWTVIVRDLRTGMYSHTFTFIGSHDSTSALGEAKQRLRGGFDVFAVVKGDHPVFSPVSGV
jgi:hypothetical protein